MCSDSRDIVSSELLISAIALAIFVEPSATSWTARDISLLAESVWLLVSFKSVLFFDIVFPAVLIFSTIVLNELLIDCISSVIRPISSFDFLIFEKSAFRLPSAISLMSLLNDESGRAIDLLKKYATIRATMIIPIRIYPEMRVIRVIPLNASFSSALTTTISWLSRIT